MEKEFNILITGIGGQGIITLLTILGEAAFIEGYEVRSSELHGLSQRGGSVVAHLRFGEKIYSPIVGSQKADLIISLEAQETLRYLSFSSSKTIFLINDYLDPLFSFIPREEIEKNLKNLKINYYFVPANKICKEKFQNEIVGGLYLLGFGIFNKLVPLKKESILKAIEKIIPFKYQELNIKAFNLAFYD